MNSRPIHVLLIEDDELVRECIVAFLEDEGFRVSARETGEEALDSILKDPPDVCLTDMRLKGMNGEEFIIAAHGLLPSIRFIIHTGGGYELSDRLREIGMTSDSLLRKPLMELSLLSRTIRSLMAAPDHGTAP